MSLKPPPENSKEDRLKIEEIINKGGKVAEDAKKELEDAKKEKEEWTMITVRLPKWMLKNMDNEINERPGLSRNAWILEALQDKLKE